MIIPPYYYTPTDDEIFNYYKAICEGCDLPIMLYNNPFTSNVDMSAKLVGRLTKAFPQIRYIKEASQRIERIQDIIRRVRRDHERLGRAARAGKLQDGRQGLREPLRQLHPPRVREVRGMGRTGPVGRRLGRSSASSRSSTRSSPRGIRSTGTSAIPRRSPPPPAIRWATCARRSRPSRAWAPRGASGWRRWCRSCRSSTPSWTRSRARKAAAE